MITLADLRRDLRSRLGDSAGAIWPDEELDLEIANGYQQLATAQDVFFDILYLDLIPRALTETQRWEAVYLATALVTRGVEEAAAFSETQPWERPVLTHLGTVSDLGPACVTQAWELTHVDANATLGAVPFIGPPAWYTNTWEADNGHVQAAGLLVHRSILVDQVGGIDAGAWNYVNEFEKRLAQNVAPAQAWAGPATITQPWEGTEGFLSRSGGDTSLPALFDLPASVTALQRVTWDKRGLDGLSPRLLQGVDSRYEITKGEVYGVLWQKDGLRTLRLVRVPAQQADTVTVSTGPWGTPRSVTDLSSDPVTGTWGVPRRIPGQQPIGATTAYGVARRPYLDTLNVKVEHFRLGRPLVASTDVCELPDRFAIYLRDYAQGRCLERPGPGQDRVLAQHFDQRWTRALVRVGRRLDQVNTQETTVLGGDGQALTTRPPRPKLPWAYGSVVR